jgi:hypothetical protein
MLERQRDQMLKDDPKGFCATLAELDTTGVLPREWA